MKRVLIAVPTNKYVETETMKSIYDLIVPPNFSTELQFFYGYQIDQVRNLIADWGKRYDYVLHVDSDIILPNDALVKMLRANKPIISGLYIQRKPGQHILEIYQDAGSGVENIPYSAISHLEIIRIAACGFGAVLVNSDVYRTLDYPHFVYSSAINHASTISEDIFFCAKARAANFSAWADVSIKCNHVGTIQHTVDNKSHLDKVAEADLLPTKHAQYLNSIEAPLVVYDIGASLLHWTRKAKESWPTASFYLIDATRSVEPYLKQSNYPYSISVLSDIDNKQVKFYEDSHNPGGNSYYKENSSAYSESHATKRSTITLDSLVKNNNWPTPDLLKLDVQGAELDILRGASFTLESVNNIILEAQHKNYNDKAPKVAEVISYLDSIGFSLVTNFCKTDVDGDYHFKRKSLLN